MRLKNSDLEILNQHFLFHLRPERNTFGRGEEGTEERERESGEGKKRGKERTRQTDRGEQIKRRKKMEEDGGRGRRRRQQRGVCVGGCNEHSFDAMYMVRIFSTRILT